MDVDDGHVELVNKTVQSLDDYLREHYQNVTNEFRPSTIYMAHDNVRNLRPSCFKPRVVSIGPLHHRDENLQRFEAQKADFIRSLFYGPEYWLAECVQKVASMIERIKGCYNAEVLHYYDDSELTKMMVMDACFLYKYIRLSSKTPYKLINQMIPVDLVLLENQIPFFVLEGICECIQKRPMRITEHLLPFFTRVCLFQGRIDVQGFCSHSDTNRPGHILGYLHHCYLPRDIKDSSTLPNSTIHSAVEFDMAGVNFKPTYQHPRWALAMELEWARSRIFCFWFKPTLTMPSLYLHESTELVLWNLIAYEQQLVVANRYITSYAGAMGTLINTHEDIATLVRSKVIVNRIGSNEEVANMMNRICKQVLVPEHFYYTPQWTQLHYHFEDYWTRKIMKLNRSNFELKKAYFSSPWRFIALLGGIALFVLTLIQTICSSRLNHPYICSTR